MRLLRHLQVLIQHWAILWIHTIVDDLVSTLDWALTTQVSNTVLGDDNLHRVLAVVVVANHWHEGRDRTALSSRRSGIDADICIASKVARTADTVHHLGTANMSRIALFFRFTSLIRSPTPPTDNRENTERTPTQLPVTKKCFFLRLLLNQVVLIPKKVDSITEKID